MPEQQETPGLALRSLRQTAGMTLQEVADAAGTDISYLSKVERGKGFPTIGYIARIARIIADGIIAAERTERAAA
ncbi:MAG: helix-turn-helix domain-containing protein [Microbacterium gubbeenense]|uniref:helix-turn-helix domain-containing protein n=1 Tax=Microbacterium gubbeenense TaxID=159896 RepID=UPI003F945133